MSIQNQTPNQKPIIEFQAKIRRICGWNSYYNVIKIPKKLSESVPDDLIVPQYVNAWRYGEVRRGIPKVKVIMSSDREVVEKEAVIKHKTKGLFIQMPIIDEYYKLRGKTLNVKVVVP